MKFHGDKVRESESGEFLASFNASAKTRRSAIATTVICGILFSFAIPIGSFMVLVLFLQNRVFERPGLLWFVLGASLLIASTLAWAWGRRRCLFFVGLTETCLQVGRDAQKLIPYEMLDIIAMHSGNSMEFIGKKFSARVFLDPESQSTCASMLMQKCPNAVFMDRLGNIDSSRMLSDSDTAPCQAAAYCRKRALNSVYDAAAGGAFAGYVLYKRLCLDEGWIFDWVLLALAVLTIALGTRGAACYFRKARQLRVQIAESRK